MLEKSFKGRFPFKVATTSFIYKAGWSANVERLAPFLDEIELVLFESRPDARPDPAEVRDLGALAETCGITYNVHLPIDLKLGHGDAVIRHRSADTVRELRSLTRELNPSTYTLHLEFDEDPADPQAVGAWQERTARSLQRILDDGMPAAMLSVENLMYPFSIATRLVERFHLRICFDVGHPALAGGDPAAAYDAAAHRIDIVHLYGIGSQGGHGSLETMPADLLRRLVQRLGRFSGVVSLEVFSYENLVSSLRCLERAWEARSANGKQLRENRQRQSPADF